MRRMLCIVGAGGFGRETADVVMAAASAAPAGQGWTIAGVYDDAPTEAHRDRLARRGLCYAGPIPQVAPTPGQPVIVAIGSPAVRERIVHRLTETGWTFPSVVHPSADVGSEAALGEGVVVCGGARVSTNVFLGRHTHVNPQAVIGHDAYLEDFVSVNPAAVISGEVRVGTRSLIGASATILQGLTVHHDAVVGANACVTRDVPAATTVKGVPAR